MEFYFFLTTTDPNFEMVKTLYSRLGSELRVIGGLDAGGNSRMTSGSFDNEDGLNDVRDRDYDEDEEGGGEKKDDQDMGTKAKNMMSSFWRSVKNEATSISF